MSFKVFWSKYGRNILKGVSYGAMVAAPIVTAVVVPKVQHKLHKAAEEGKTSKLDKVKACAPEVALVAGITALGVGTGIAADNMASSTISSLNAVIAAEQAAKKATDDVLNEALPEKDLAEIQKKIAQKKDETVPAVAKPKTASLEYTIDTGNGSIEFREPWTKQIFLSDWNYIQSRVNELNSRINEGFDVTLNEFLAAIGIDRAEAGDAYYFPKGIKLDLEWITNDKGQPRGRLSYADGYEPTHATRRLNVI